MESVARLDSFASPSTRSKCKLAGVGFQATIKYQDERVKVIRLVVDFVHRAPEIGIPGAQDVRALSPWWRREKGRSGV